MRAEFVSPYDHSPHTGIGRYLHTIVQQLSESIDVTICRPRFLPVADHFSPLKSLPVGIADHVQGSVVHFPQIMGCAMMLYRPYHPSIATVHDLGALELPAEWAMLDPTARQMLRLSLAGLKRVDRIVAVSDFTRQGIIKHLGVPEERVVTIHSGIDHDVFRPIPNAREELLRLHPELQPHSASPWMMYVGSELPRKNVGTLLRAVAMVREERPDIQLIKVGSPGGERYRCETLKTIDELGLRDSVLIFEGIAEEEMPLFYGAADVCATASYLEGFCFPVLEAMACGTPVVCSGAGSLPEIAGDAAVYWDAHDAGAMSLQVRGALAKGKDETPSRFDRIQRAARFQWGASAQALAAEYRLLSEGCLHAP